MMTIALIENATLVVSVGSFAASIAAKGIEHKFDALTHYLDRRARIELDELADRLNRFATFARDLADDSNIVAGFDGSGEVERFARKHVALTRAFWEAESRCLNWFITGPANFPKARNEKRQAAAQKRRQEISDHEAKARKAIRARALPFGAEGDPIRSNDPDAIAKIEAKIAALSDAIDSAKAANRIIRRMEKANAEEADMVKAVVAETNATPEIAARAIVLQPWQTRRGYDTTGDRAELRRLKGRLATLRRTQERGTISQTVETETAAFEVKENADIARLQLIFPGKPDAETRALLKSNGFRWSPRETAWQRHLNEAGRWAAKRVMAALEGSVSDA
jgi:hypothetical protein